MSDPPPPGVEVTDKTKQPRLFMAGNIRDGTGRYYCFDMFGGENIEDETGRDGKIVKIMVTTWMGRDGTVGVNFLDGTGRDGTV